MDFKKLGNILMVASAVVLGGACIWWFAFYSSVVREIRKAGGGQGDASVFDAVSCLYTSSDFCGLVAGGARLLGKTPYEPMVFWLGLAGLVAGAIIRLAAKPSPAS